MEKLLNILKSIRDDIDYEKEQNMIDDGVLDSFDVVAIVGEISAEYNVDITIDDITAENFNSVAAMLEMIERVKNRI